VCRPGRCNGAPTELRNMTVDGGRSGRRVASDEHSAKNRYVIDITGYCRSIIYRGLVILLLQRLCQLSPPIILSAQTRLDHLQTPRNLRGRIFSCARSLMRTNQETSYIVTGFPASPHQIPCSGSMSTARKFSPLSIHSIRCAGRRSNFWRCATTGAETACLMRGPTAGWARYRWSGPMFSNPTS